MTIFWVKSSIILHPLPPGHPPTPPPSKPPSTGLSPVGCTSYWALQIRIRDLVPFWELYDNFLGKKFYNSHPLPPGHLHRRPQNHRPQVCPCWLYCLPSGLCPGPCCWSGVIYENCCNLDPYKSYKRKFSISHIRDSPIRRKLSSV